MTQPEILTAKEVLACAAVLVLLAGAWAWAC